MTDALPVPAPALIAVPDLADFWAATAEGVLLLRRCAVCGEAIWYPRSYCPGCGSLKTVSSPSSGEGTVYSYTIVHRSSAEGYQNAAPYVVAYIELEEGPRVLTNVVGCDPEAVHIGMPVRVVFDDTGEGCALYRFAPRSE